MGSNSIVAARGISERSAELEDFIAADRVDREITIGGFHEAVLDQAVKGQGQIGGIDGGLPLLGRLRNRRGSVGGGRGGDRDLGMHGALGERAS